MKTSDEESETESENEDLGNSSEEDEDEVSSSLSDNEEKISCDEAEDNSDSDNEPEPANNIPIVIGLRQPPIIPPLSQLNVQKRVQIGDRQKNYLKTFGFRLTPPLLYNVQKKDTF